MSGTTKRNLPTSGRMPILDRRRLLGLGGTLGLSGLTLAACSGGSGQTSGAATPSGNKVQDFSFTSFALSEEPPKEWIQDTIADYESEHGISISTTSYPFNNALNQMLLQSRGGELTGIAHLNIEWLAPMAATGLFVDLSEYTSGTGYTDAALATGQHNGTQYGIPWTTAAIGLIGNSELLEQAGVDSAPATLDEFEDALRAVKSLGSDIVPYAASTEVAQLKDFVVWLQTFGSPVMEDGACTLGDDASVEAMEWYKMLYTDGLIAPDMERNAARNLFSQGRTAYYDDAPIGTSIVAANSPDENILSKMVPTARPVRDTGDVPQALAWGHILVVAEGDGSTAAAEFANWITSDQETVLAYFEESGNPPVTTEGLESDLLQDQEFLSAFTAKITDTASPSPLWDFPEYAQLEASIAESVQSVLIGDQTPQEGMKAAGDAVNGLLP